MLKRAKLTIAATTIREMDEIFHEKKLTHSIVTQEQIIIAFDTFFFYIFLSMVIPAFKIKNPTPILIPLNAFAMIVNSKKLSKYIDMK